MEFKIDESIVDSAIQEAVGEEVRKLLGNGGVVKTDNGMVGKYVIVRCRDAGVHAGVLDSHTGRECVLLNSRRLWKYVPADGRKWLSGVAVAGLGDGSSIGAEVPRIHLTENCEIILTTDQAMVSISSFKEDRNDW